MKKDDPDAPATTASTQNHGDNPFYKRHQSQGGHSAYRKTPWVIYFYYISGSVENPQIARYVYNNYFIPLDYNEVPEVMRDLGLNARKPRAEQYPWPETTGPTDIEWNRRLYLAFLIDIPDVSFENEENGIVFTAQKSAKENVSFYDAKVCSVDLDSTGSTRLNALYCINHMKKDRGGQNEDSDSYYHFDLFTQPRLGREKEYPDSGGTNVGPPVPP